VAYGTFYVNGLGYEPRVVGAIAAAEQGVVSPLIEGASGAYVFVVDSIAAEARQGADAQKVRIEATAESMAQQKAIPAVQEMAEIKDLRGKYF